MEEEPQSSETSFVVPQPFRLFPANAQGQGLKQQGFATAQSVVHPGTKKESLRPLFPQ
jgi:hypothetical protein